MANHELIEQLQHRIKTLERRFWIGLLCFVVLLCLGAQQALSVVFYRNVVVTEQNAKEKTTLHSDGKVEIGSQLWVQKIKSPSDLIFDNLILTPGQKKYGEVEVRGRLVVLENVDCPVITSHLRVSEKEAPIAKAKPGRLYKSLVSGIYDRDQVRSAVFHVSTNHDGTSVVDQERVSQHKNKRAKFKIVENYLFISEHQNKNTFVGVYHN